MKKGNYAETVNGVASTASTECTNQQQWTKYHSKQGHGFAAEDANALWEYMITSLNTTQYPEDKEK